MKVLRTLAFTLVTMSLILTACAPAAAPTAAPTEAPVVTEEPVASNFMEIPKRNRMESVRMTQYCECGGRMICIDGHHICEDYNEILIQAFKELKGGEEEYE